MPRIGQALVEAVRMIPGEKHLVFEEGLQSAWPYETRCPHVTEIVIAGITESRGPNITLYPPNTATNASHEGVVPFD